MLDGMCVPRKGKLVRLDGMCKGKELVLVPHIPYGQCEVKIIVFHPEDLLVNIINNWHLYTHVHHYMHAPVVYRVAPSIQSGT